MDNHPTEPVPPELQVLMDTEIHLKGPISYPDQQKLETLLLAMPGVVSLAFTENSLTLRYDAERVTKAGLCEAVTRAGLQIAEAQSAPTSPPVEPQEENPT